MAPCDSALALAAMASACAPKTSSAVRTIATTEVATNNPSETLEATSEAWSVLTKSEKPAAAVIEWPAIALRRATRATTS